MAAASKLFLLTSSLFRTHRRRFLPFHPPPLCNPSFHPLSPHLFPIPILRPTLLPRHRFYTTAVAVDGPAAGLEEPAAASDHHPWPEWERFVDKLRSKGYFTISSSEGDTRAPPAAFAESESVDSMELNRVKNACLKFARERFDILRSLPKEDIQAVVECGCPNLFRKAVNSAKRLRAFLRLDEGDVCSACNLKGSCDKAYVIAKEDEAARTVDIVRILLTYAINPTALLGGGTPPVKVQVQESARKLLSELIKLSDTTIDPALPKPATQSPSQKDQSRKVDSKNKLPLNVEMKRGDWLCSNCNFLNFARNMRCLECKEDGPKKVNPESVEMKLGDWTCPKCQFMNFSRNRMCLRCQDSRPKRQLNSGEWECPSCDFVNFRRNNSCLKCNCNLPDNEGSQFDDHAWRKPRQAGRNTTLKFGDDVDDDDVIGDEEDDILPLREGGNKLLTSKRASPSVRRLTSARKRSYPS